MNTDCPDPADELDETYFIGDRLIARDWTPFADALAWVRRVYRESSPADIWTGVGFILLACVLAATAMAIQDANIQRMVTEPQGTKEAR